MPRGSLTNHPWGAFTRMFFTLITLPVAGATPAVDSTSAGDSSGDPDGVSLGDSVGASDVDGDSDVPSGPSGPSDSASPELEHPVRKRARAVAAAATPDRGVTSCRLPRAQ